LRLIALAPVDSARVDSVRVDAFGIDIDRDAPTDALAVRMGVEPGRRPRSRRTPTSRAQAVIDRTGLGRQMIGADAHAMTGLGLGGDDHRRCAANGTGLGLDRLTIALWQRNGKRGDRRGYGHASRTPVTPNGCVAKRGGFLTHRARPRLFGFSIVTKTRRGVPKICASAAYLRDI
jgi:hypothetical protein